MARGGPGAGTGYDWSLLSYSVILNTTKYYSLLLNTTQCSRLCWHSNVFSINYSNDGLCLIILYENNYNNCFICWNCECHCIYTKQQWYGFPLNRRMNFFGQIYPHEKIKIWWYFSKPIRKFLLWDGWVKLPNFCLNIYSQYVQTCQTSFVIVLSLKQGWKASSCE